MRLLKIWGLALIGVFAISAAATATASAELTKPVFHIVGAVGGTTTAKGELNKAEVATLLSTELSKGFATSGVKLTLEIKDLVGLGLYKADFTGMRFEGKECDTEGDADETILVNGEYHLRILNKALELGIEFLLPAGGFTILCSEVGSKLKVTLKILTTGSVLAKIDLDGPKGEPLPLQDMEKVKSVIVLLKCTKPGNGIQEFKSYINDKDEEVKAKLTTEIISGLKEPACNEIKEGLLITAEKELETLF